MPSNRSVPPGEEPVEFRPLPGQEEYWAEYSYVERSAGWYWIGVFPVGLLHMILLLLVGMVFSGR